MNSSESASRRLASIVSLVRRARQTFERFPLVLISSILAALVLHHLANIDFDDDRAAQALYPLLMAASLGIPGFFSLRMLAEGHEWPRRLRWVTNAVTLVGLAAYYATLPYPLKGADLVDYFLLVAALHLLASFAPFLMRAGAENGFWQYNKTLLLRFAAALLYSGVLYIGLVLAVAACETLLDIDFDNAIYLQLFYWIAFVYNTWFFLAGIPEDVRELQETQTYPVALRVFTQYVLIPLVGIYLIILYAYMAKIIVEWDLPKGWVGYPVIGVAVTGMLALLLVHPIRGRSDSAWVASYSRYIYWALFPLLGLLGVAIGTRIAAYGLTEKRYLVVVAATWLLGIAFYFTLKRRADIRVIPISLCVITLLSVVGPWGATNVSRASQLGRLRAMLIEGEVIVDETIREGSRTLEFEPQREISNILRYLHDYHGLDHLRGWYAGGLPEDLTPELAMYRMGLEYIGPWVTGPGTFNISAEAPNPLSVAGFDFVFETNRFWNEEPSRFSTVIDNDTRLTLEGTIVSLGLIGSSEERLSADLAPLVLALRDQRARTTPGVRRTGARTTRTTGDATAPEPRRTTEPAAAEAMSGRGAAISADNRLEVEDASYRLIIYLTSVGGSVEGDTLKLTQLSATFLIDLKVRD